MLLLVFYEFIISKSQALQFLKSYFPLDFSDYFRLWKIAPLARPHAFTWYLIFNASLGKPSPILNTDFLDIFKAQSSTQTNAEKR